jgi:hypothetical protein
MTIYLNDLSLAGGQGLLEDWDKFNAFNDLIDELIRIGQVSLVAPKDLWSMPLGGVDVAAKAKIGGTPLPTDKGNFVQQVYRKFIPKTQGEPLFSETKDMAVASSSVGEAAENGAPVVSITFDDHYAQEKLDGWLKLAGEDAVKKNVNNIFTESAKNLTFITDLTQCRQKNPQKEPLWNQSVVQKLLKGVDFINGSKEEKRQRFIDYGRKVAESNGWVYNRRISSLNSDNQKKRIVFDSERLFTGYAISYLSIDLEGPDLCFELCDKRGCHLGEVDRNGVVSKPEQHHNLTV